MQSGCALRPTALIGWISPAELHVRPPCLALVLRLAVPCVLAAYLVLTAPMAEAGERRVELHLANGRTLKGVVLRVEGDDVILRIGTATKRPVPLDTLAPKGLFRVREVLAPATDGNARLKLAELAVDLGLFAEARVEFEKALALGALSESKFKSTLRKAEQTAVHVGIARARKLAEDGDVEAALGVARELKMEFAAADGAKKIESLIEDLVKDLRARKESDAAARAELEAIKLGTRRKKEVFRRMTVAADLVRGGRGHARASAASRKQGSVTRARKSAELSDADFMTARRQFGRLRQILTRKDPERAQVLQSLTRLDKEQFAVRFGMAKFLFYEAGSFTQAEKWAALASYIDPVHPDLIELRDRIIASRIRYRLSDMTNARGRVTGGGVR